MPPHVATPAPTHPHAWPKRPQSPPPRETAAFSMLSTPVSPRGTSRGGWGGGVRGGVGDHFAGVGRQGSVVMRLFADDGEEGLVETADSDEHAAVLGRLDELLCRWIRGAVGFGDDVADAEP